MLWMNIWSLFARRNGESGSYLVNKNGFSLYEVLFLESMKSFIPVTPRRLTGRFGAGRSAREAESPAGGQWEGLVGWLLPIDF